MLVFRYLSNYLDNLFAGAWEPQDTKPLKVNIPFASSDTGEDCFTFELGKNVKLVTFKHLLALFVITDRRDSFKLRD